MSSSYSTTSMRKIQLQSKSQMFSLFVQQNCWQIHRRVLLPWLLWPPLHRPLHDGEGGHQWSLWQPLICLWANRHGPLWVPHTEFRSFLPQIMWFFALRLSPLCPPPPVFSNMEKAKKLLKAELWGAVASRQSWWWAVNPRSAIPQKTAHCKVSSPFMLPGWSMFVCVTAAVHYQLCWINAHLLTSFVALLTFLCHVCAKNSCMWSLRDLK